MTLATPEEIIKLAIEVLTAADSPCGCLTILTESTSLTIRYGICTSKCSAFTGCPRNSSDLLAYADDCVPEIGGDRERHC
jgi:hypothetical protein